MATRDRSHARNQPYGALPGEAEVVDRMVAMRREGLGAQAIANQLNLDEVPTRHRAVWHEHTVRRILRRVDSALMPRRQRAAYPQHEAPARHRAAARMRQHRHRLRTEGLQP